MPPSPCDLPGVGRLCDVPGDIVGAAAGSAWETLVSSFSDAVGKSVQLLFTFWTDIPTPALDAPGGTVEFIRSSTSWYTSALAVLAFVVAAGRIAITHRGEHAAQLSQAMVRLLVTTFLGVPVVTALCAAGDAYSDWVLDRSTDGDFGGRVVALAGVTELAGANGIGSALVFLFSLLALFGSIGQMLMMFVRAGMLPLLTGLLPMFAAVSNTESGKQMNDRAVAWLAAFVLYKPAAATVYAGGFTSAAAGGVVGTVSGLFLLVLAVLTLPALLRLAVPAVAAAAGGGSGGGGVAVGGVLATGALAAVGGQRSQHGGPRGGGSAGLDGGHGAPSGSALTGGPQGGSWPLPQSSGGGQGQGGPGAGGGGAAGGAAARGPTGAAQVVGQAAAAAGSGIRGAGAAAAGEEDR